MVGNLIELNSGWVIAESLDRLEKYSAGMHCLDVFWRVFRTGWRIFSQI